MRVLVDVTHPAHVHLFRNAIKELEDDGHDVAVCSREKDITTDLLSIYGIDHTVLSRRRSGQLPLLLEWPQREIASLQYYRNVDPDIVLSRFNPAAAHVASLLDIPHLVFEDTEPKPWVVKKLTYPFSHQIHTPDCFQRDLGPRQRSYPGYHELAYLHPNWFEPDPSVLDEFDLEEDDQIVVLRLVSWEAVHDVGETGFDDIEDIISRLESTGAQVVITSELRLPDKLDEYKSNVGIEEMHHLLHFADLLIGESATMAAESAVLGTPAVFVSTTQRGYTDELDGRYGLVFNFADTNRHARGLEKSLEILQKDNSALWKKRREKLLSEKIDTTEYILTHTMEVAENGR
ncbi:DUF354 domain-containing protein [Halalkalicoccus ordinarius]|uniref:DUF354 domain-containing protein n=1 Tax=Halalkalicoccus ordinarius TaxID=3116651 RepID=UPI00300EC587